MKPLLMLVDDNPEIRSMLRRLLEFEETWDVVEADDGEIALKTFQALRPAAVLLDQMLPVSSGLEIARILREVEGFKGPLLLYSSAGQLASRIEADRLDVQIIEKSEVTWLLEVLREVAVGISAG